MNLISIPDIYCPRGRCRPPSYIREAEILDNNTTECTYKQGSLPGCAPLGLAVTPMQSSSEPAYENDEALSRGTLFPGLDLPFMNIVNKMPAKSTPLRVLMALDFVCNEMALYLDTHSDDAEAFATYQSMLRLYEEGRNTYASTYGPLQRSDLAYTASFTWLNDPWPWDYAKEG